MRHILKFFAIIGALVAMCISAHAQVSVSWKEEIENAELRATATALAAEVNASESALDRRRALRRIKDKLERELRSVGYLNPNVQTLLTPDAKEFGRVEINLGDR